MRLYAAMRNALLVVEGETGEFRARRRLTEYDLECVAAHSETPDRALVGTFDDGLLRTTDGGETFESVDAFADGRVTSVAVNPRDPAEWWVGTEPSAVYRSTDGGETWARREGLTDLPSAEEWSFPPRPDTHHVRWIEVDPEDPDHLYVGIEAGALVQTRDRGETWEDRVRSSRRDNHSLATHSDAPGRAWAAAGDGFAETADAGETWDHPQAGLDHRYCWSVAVDPGDPETVLLSAASGPRSAHDAGSAESYVYRRRGGVGSDGGEETAGRWERCDGDLPSGKGALRAVLTPGREAGEFYALTNRGLYRTADAGDDGWVRLGVEWDESFESQTPRGLSLL